MRFLSYLAILCIFASTARAQFTEVFTDNFDDGNIDEYVEADIIGQILTGVTGEPTRFQQVSFPDGGVRITSPPTPNPEFGPARGGFEQRIVSVTNFDISVDVIGRGQTSNSAWCVSARTKEIGPGTSDGYIFCGGNIIEGEDDTFFAIDIFQDELISVLASTPEEAPLSIAPATKLRVNFRGVGNRLTGTVFDLADLSTPLVELSVVDDTFTEGFTGFAMGAAGPPDMIDITAFGDGTFDNYSLSVPEPSATLLCVLGLFGLLALRRNK